jgi:hypothetical protein
MFREREQAQIDSAIADYQRVENSSFIEFVVDHFESGSHQFQGLNSYLVRWHETWNAEVDEQRFMVCEICGLRPWEVSALPEDFYSLNFLTREEVEHLDVAKQEGKFWEQLKHLAACKHEWFEFDHPRDPLCGKCNLRLYEVSQAGDFDAIYLCDF